MISSTPPFDESMSHPHRDAPAAAIVLPVVSPADVISGGIDSILTKSARIAQSGNLAARNALFVALQPKLFQQARRIRPWMLPESWDRSDLEQEAFVVYAQLLEAWSGEGSFSGYMLGHFGWRMRNVVRHARDRERLPVARLETAALVDDDSWAAQESRILLEEIASHFTPIEQAILLGRVRDGEGFGALAHQLGLSRKTVYRHWVVIVLELRKSLGLPVLVPDSWSLARKRRTRGHWHLRDFGPIRPT
jgi:RNA polymerase sigma factor (sigma-70 family)